jgi:hypothetical protein
MSLDEEVKAEIHAYHRERRRSRSQSPMRRSSPSPLRSGVRRTGREAGGGRLPEDDFDTWSRHEDEDDGFGAAPRSDLHHGAPRQHDEDGGGADDREPCEMFEAAWPPPSEDDKWNFLQSYDLPAAFKVQNPYYEQFFTFANQYGQEKEYIICLGIQRHYDEVIYPKLDATVRRRWTLNSIREWVRDRARGPARMDRYRQIVHQRINILTDGELYERDRRTGRRFVNPKADDTLQKYIRLGLQLEGRK